MSQSDTAEVSIPLVQEHVKVNKRTVETGRVRIRSVVDEKLVRVAEDLEREDVIIERVPVRPSSRARPTRGNLRRDGWGSPVHRKLLDIERAFNWKRPHCRAM